MPEVSGRKKMCGTRELAPWRGNYCYRLFARHRMGRQRVERDRILQLLKSSSITSACDLDVLLFFTRHSDALLTADQIAAFVGYDTRVVTEAIERFVAASVVGRVQAADRPASLYVLAADDRLSEALFSLLDVASSRPGMLAVRDALSSRTARGRARAGRSSSKVVSE